MPQKALLMGHSLTHAVKYIKFTIYSVLAACCKPIGFDPTGYPGRPRGKYRGYKQAGLYHEPPLNRPNQVGQ